MKRVLLFMVGPLVLFLGALNGLLATALDADLYRFGVPDTGDIHERAGYVMSYDGRQRGARWTLELLTRKSLAGHADRANLSFREDEDVLAECRARPKDYEASGFDIGHQAAAANHVHSQAELRDTFRLSNASPQYPEFNRGRWNELEKYVRALAETDHVSGVWVLTGPLWIPDGSRQCIRFIGPSAVPVATHFYKSILILGDDGTITPRTWIIEHKRDPAELEDCRCAIDDLERWAGFDAWPKLPNQGELETKR